MKLDDVIGGGRYALLLATEVIDTETFSDMHDTALKMLANS